MALTTVTPGQNRPGDVLNDKDDQDEQRLGKKSRTESWLDAHSARDFGTGYDGAICG